MCWAGGGGKRSKKEDKMRAQKESNDDIRPRGFLLYKYLFSNGSFLVKRGLEKGRKKIKLHN
jgi:hypothetical protein